MEDYDPQAREGPGSAPTGYIHSISNAIQIFLSADTYRRWLTCGATEERNARRFDVGGHMSTVPRRGEEYCQGGPDPEFSSYNVANRSLAQFRRRISPLTAAGRCKPRRRSLVRDDEWQEAQLSVITCRRII